MKTNCQYKNLKKIKSIHILVTIKYLWFAIFTHQQDPLRKFRSRSIII